VKDSASDPLAHQNALNLIKAAADTHFIRYHHFPSRVRLGAAIANDFLGSSLVAYLPMPSSKPVKTVLIMADYALDPRAIVLDD
jgi:hypothetical protein